MISLVLLVVLLVVLFTSSSVEARRGSGGGGGYPGKHVHNRRQRPSGSGSASGKWGTGQAPYFDLSPAAQEDLAKDLRQTKATSATTKKVATPQVKARTYRK